jgi:hypothetical protein
MRNRTGSRALPKEYTLTQRLSHFLEANGGHFTAASLGGIFKRQPVAVGMTLGRLAKKDSNIQKDAQDRWYFAKGQEGAQAPTAKIAADIKKVADHEAEVFDAEPAGIAQGDWRGLDALERNIIQTLAQRGRINGEITGRRGLRVTYIKNTPEGGKKNPNFTTALLRVGSYLFVGVSKFNPNDDNYDELIGQQRAFARACHSTPLSI